MIKRSTLVWMMLAVFAGIGLFILKYDVSEMEDRLAALQRETRGHLEAIHVLKAEWSYLNQPARLDDLGQRLLSLEPVDADQSVAIGDIPFRPEVGLVAAPGVSAPPAADRDPPPKITFTRVP